jgi:hypothetical protein
MGTGDKDLDAELIFTQFRKVAECMAYAFLAANKIGYSKKHRDISTVWKAKELLKRLEAVNPEFYPVGLLEPLIYVPGRKHYERAPDGFLTNEDFVTLYQGSSRVLHVRNPYSTKDPVINLKYTVQEWVSRIQKLLGLHFVQLVGGDVWLIQIPGEGPVHLAMASPTTDEAAA